MLRYYAEIENGKVSIYAKLKSEHPPIMRYGPSEHVRLTLIDKLLGVTLEYKLLKVYGKACARCEKLNAENATIKSASDKANAYLKTKRSDLK